MKLDLPGEMDSSGSDFVHHPISRVLLLEIQPVDSRSGQFSGPAARRLLSGALVCSDAASRLADAR